MIFAYPVTGMTRRTESELRHTLKRSSTLSYLLCARRAGAGDAGAVVLEAAARDIVKFVKDIRTMQPDEFYEE